MNNKKQAIILAKLRAQEIAKKSKNVIKAGNIESSHKVLTNIDRLIKCDHYKRTGANLRLSNRRDELARIMQELKFEKGQAYKLVKRDEGKTIQVIECLKSRK